ncbi:hypothetical protein PRZ48_009851 [Zasmidium cellare]|uniref:C2H2-type domain-containing protein n=1 Tax=Zasmidium cellare TaxID=395010 RepID=A0ABR0EDR6_ZASCE|nr:hypothetical protein PRZ48_009851 [Zasmidium cellare]
MASFPADDCFGSYDFTQDSSLSYTGTAPELDQTFRYHYPGCNRTCPVEVCFYCSGSFSSGYMRNPSLSPPAQQYPQPIPIIQERAPTPSRTYAQVATQALGTNQVASPAALAAARQLRPQLPQQARPQPAVQRHSGSNTSQRSSSAAHLAQRRSYAQAAQQARNSTSTRRQFPNAQPAYGNVQQSGNVATTPQSWASFQGHASYQGQVHQSGGFTSGQTYPAPPTYPATPQQPTMSTQTWLQIPMENLASILRPEYTNNPRNVEDMVDGAQRGSHRHPMSTHSSGNSTPLTPASPGCPWAFVNPKDLNRHFAVKHPNSDNGPPERFYCQWDGCEKSYTRADNLQRHMDKDHEVDSGLGYSPSMSRTTSQSSYRARPY